MIRAIYAVVVLDLKRAWLDRIRLAVGLLQPLLYLFVLGSGLGSNSTMAAYYRPYIFPGVLGLSLLFSAVFSAITIVFDRQVGFFKAVLVAPLPRPAIALGKITAGAIQSFVQGVIILPFAPLAHVSLSFPTFCGLIGAMMLAAMTFSAMGVSVAARFTSTTVFPVVSNALLLPMFFLSGALYPLGGTGRWMQIAAHFDPVAYAVDLMRGAVLSTPGSPLAASHLKPFFFPVALSVSCLVGVIAVLAWSAVRTFNRGEDDSSLGAARFNWRR
jgi:ABC-2 type transport system permease protein